MATISNATTGNDILVPTNDDVTYRGLSGDDVYILSSAIASDAKISIVDTSGANRIQLVDGLSIASSRFAADAVELTLSNGAVVTVNGADKFTFEVGGNDTSGTVGTDQTYSAFADAMGVASLPSGSTLVAGSANVSVSGASIGGGVGAGSVTILTTGYDEVTGGAGNDTYIGVIGSGTTLTANSFDVIDGGDGNDTVSLNLSDANYSGDTTITNVETMSFRASGAARTADLLQQSGVTEINNDRSTADLTVSGAANIMDLTVDRNTGNSDTKLTYDVVPTIGTGTTQNITLKGLASTNTGTVDVDTAGADGVEIVNLTSTGALLGQKIGTLTIDNVSNASTLETLNISGDSKLTITSALDFAGTAVGAVTTGTVDASASSGGVLVTFGASENNTFIGGSGNDKATFGANFGVYDSVDGGDGTDTLVVSGVDTVSFSAGNLGTLTNTEIVQLTATNGNTATFTRADLSTATNWHFVENATDDMALTNSSLKAGDTVGIIQANDNGVGTVTLGLADASGSADELNVQLYGVDAKTAAQNDIADISFTAVETLNILSDVGVVVGTEKLTTTEANTINDISADTALTAINITGDDNLTLTVGAEASLLATLDASAFTGNLSATLSNVAANISVTGGSGNDTINMGAGLNNGDTIVGGGNLTATTADRVTATIAGLATTSGTGNLNITDVEFIDLLTATSASTISAAGISGASRINVGGPSGASGIGLTIKDLPAGLTVGVGEMASVTNDEYTGTLTVSLADETGDADEITFLLADTDGDDEVGASLVTNAAVETVNIIASGNLVDDPADDNDAQLDISKVKASTIVVSGGDSAYTEDLDLAGSGSATLHVNTSTVNAAAHKGTLTLIANPSTALNYTSQGVVAQTITGSSKNDTIDLTFAAGSGTADHDIDGLGGTDTLKLFYNTGTNTAVDNINNVEILDVTVGASQAVDLTQAAGDFLNDAAATQLYIRGGNSLSSFNLADDPIDGNEVTLIDATNFNGRINSIAFDADMLANTTVIKGGASAKDTISFGTDTDGTTRAPNLTSIEYVEYTHNSGNTAGEEASTVALTAADGISRLILMSGDKTNTQTMNVTDYDSAKHGTIWLGKAAGTPFADDDGANINITHASSTGTEDTLNLMLADLDGTTGTTTLTSDGTEITNITILNNTEAHTINTTAVDATTGSTGTFNISGYLAGASSSTTLNMSTTDTKTTVIDASAYAGTFNLTDRGAVNMTITGSLGADTIQMEKEGDVINSGTGADTLDVNYYAIISGITVDLSKTDDQILSFDGAATSGTVTGFENVDLRDYTGGFGANITSGSSTVGTYSIKGTDAADSIYFGLGADTYQYYDDTGANNVDTIHNYVIASDKVEISNAAVESALGTNGQTAVLTLGGSNMATGTLAVQEISAGATLADTTELLIFLGATGNAATTAALVKTGAGRVLAVNAGNDDVGDAFFVLYSDGTDGFLGVLIEGASGNGSDTDLEDPVIINLIKFVGETSIAASEYSATEFELIT